MSFDIHRSCNKSKQGIRRPIERQNRRYIKEKDSDIKEKIENHAFFQFVSLRYLNLIIPKDNHNIPSVSPDITNPLGLPLSATISAFRDDGIFFLSDILKDIDDKSMKQDLLLNFHAKKQKNDDLIKKVIKKGCDLFNLSMETTNGNISEIKCETSCFLMNCPEKTDVFSLFYKFPLNLTEIAPFTEEYTNETQHNYNLKHPVYKLCWVYTSNNDCLYFTDDKEDKSSVYCFSFLENKYVEKTFIDEKTVKYAFYIKSLDDEAMTIKPQDT